MIQAIVSPTTKQNLTLQAAKRLIRRRATPSDADDLIDLFRADTASGVPIHEALKGVLQWVEAEANPVPAKRITTGHSPGFAIVPRELLEDRNFQESLPHDLRVFLQLLQYSNGGRGVAYPSTKTLANSTFIEEGSSVRRSLRNLERKGWIQTLEPQGKRRAKTRRIVLPSNPDSDRPQLGHPTPPPLKKKEEIREKTTTTATLQSASTSVTINKGGGGFPAKTSKQQTPTTEPTSIIVNSQSLPGASKTILNLVENLLKRANLPEDIAKGMLSTTAEASKSGAIRTSEDRYLAGLIGKYRDGCYIPQAVLQAEVASEKAEARAEIRRKEEEAERVKEAEEKALKEKLDLVKAEFTPNEMAKHKADFIEQLRSQKSLSFQRYKAAGWQGFGFDLGFDGYLRKTLLT